MRGIKSLFKARGPARAPRRASILPGARAGPAFSPGVRSSTPAKAAHEQHTARLLDGSSGGHHARTSTRGPGPATWSLPGGGRGAPGRGTSRPNRAGRNPKTRQTRTNGEQWQRIRAGQRRNSTLEGLRASLVRFCRGHGIAHLSGISSNPAAAAGHRIRQDGPASGRDSTCGRETAHFPAVHATKQNTCEHCARVGRVRDEFVPGVCRAASSRLSR